MLGRSAGLSCPVEVFFTCPAGRRPPGKARLCWRDYFYHLSLKGLCALLQAEVVGEKMVCCECYHDADRLLHQKQCQSHRISSPLRVLSLYRSLSFFFSHPLCLLIFLVFILYCHGAAHTKQQSLFDRVWCISHV